MISPRYRRSGQLLLVGAALGAILAPGAALADGPGYGGTADTLTVQWQAESKKSDGLAVYAVGFRGGSPVQLRVGADAERTIAADQSGALRVLVVNTEATAPTAAEDTTVLKVDQTSTNRFSAGTSVLALGETPAGDIRRLIGSVPPPEAGRGVQDLAPWAGAVAALAAAAVWARRQGFSLTAAMASTRARTRFHPAGPPDEKPPSRHRHHPRHRATPTHAAA
ncbi:hypothetical protein [Actinoplanes sp. NPDC051494]|uniref:hypothetical protein n=1 Tax=Actinoplanes sp. NPDC051494 TaxID=3363907 RepID=UPI0037ACF67B